MNVGILFVVLVVVVVLVQVSVIALKLLAYMAMVMKMDYNAYVQASKFGYYAENVAILIEFICDA